MLCEEERAEAVDLKGFEGFGVVDLGWGFFRVEDTGDAECKAEVAGREARGAMRCCGRYRRFIWKIM